MYSTLLLNLIYNQKLSMPQYQIFHIIHLFYKEIHYAVFLLIKKDTLTMKKYLHDKKKQPLNKAAILK